MSLRVRLLASFALVLLIPLVTLGLLAPLVYSRSFEEEINGHTRQMIDQVSRRIDDLVADLDASMSYFQTGPQARAFFEGGNPRGWNGLVADLEHFQQVRSDEVAGIALVSSDNRFLGVGLHPVTRAPLTNESWFQQAARDPGQVRLFSRPIGRNLRSDLGLGADDVVAVVRAENGGVVLFDLKVSQIERIFRGLSLGPSGFLFIVDNEGSIVYSPVNSLVYRILPEWLPGEAGLAVHRFGGTDYQLQSRWSRATGWRTIGVFSLPEALREAETLRLYALVSGLAALILAFFSSLLLTSGFVQPILTLRSLMKRAENGDLNVHFSARGHDEVGQLGAGFNTMIEEIRHLIEEVAEVQQAKREAELQVLQEQIKPHFLYNTLDTIHWMAQEHGARDITAVVSALTKLFRIGLSRGQENIALAEEIEHVKSYLFIQKVRYEEKFDYRIAVPHDLLEARVLRLILQPLVENAIYHGLKPKRGPGVITVSASREADILILAVEDDGVGLDSTQRKRFNDALAQGTLPEEGAGYGVFNGNERLRLSFGLHYGLRFVEPLAGGTRVEVRHPWIEGKGGEDAMDSFDRR
jgi:two-component system sensor histidine kinase YesM